MNTSSYLISLSKCAHALTFFLSFKDHLFLCVLKLGQEQDQMFAKLVKHENLKRFVVIQERLSCMEERTLRFLN